LTSAPSFFEVAKRIIEITNDCVVVAHNGLWLSNSKNGISPSRVWF
jgi:DNA polymerase III epsilon subunit-like protein